MSPDTTLLVIDELDTAHISGWALPPAQIGSIVARIDGQLIGPVGYGFERPDVAQAYPGVPNGSKSGFALTFPGSARVRAGANLGLEAKDLRGRTLAAHSVAISRSVLPRRFKYRPFDSSIDKPTFAPFPHGVVSALNAADPQTYELEGQWSNDTIAQAAEDIARLTRGAKQPSPLTHYICFLEGLAGRYRYLRDEFPVIATTVAEMLCIAHHLYVLRSYGLKGPLAEFGCFKGFSTSCLSYAAHELGLTIDSFDSFEGLPAANGSTYGAGDFAGSLDEVRDNVHGFGVLEAVEMHKGFFADSLPNYKGSPLAIWMDVDLEISSRDVMTLLPRVEKLGCVFTHEAVAEFIADGKVTVAPGPDSVLPPIVAAFTRAARNYTARHIVDCLSCLWDPETSLPPLSYTALARLVRI